MIASKGTEGTVPDVPVPEKFIEGEIKANKMKLIQAWIEIHNEELMANWELALKGENIYKIDPLK
ncbi:MAG: DUF4160 domain-containing protein [Desulfosporosinus sp.]